MLVGSPTIQIPSLIFLLFNSSINIGAPIHAVSSSNVKENSIYLNQEIDKYANEILLPDMKKIFPNASIEKNIIGEIIGFDREDESDACELISSLTGDNSRQVVSFGTEAGLFQEIGISTVVCGPGSIDQAHKPNEFIEMEQIDACEAFLDRLMDRVCNN